MQLVFNRRPEEGVEELDWTRNGGGCWLRHVGSHEGSFLIEYLINSFAHVFLFFSSIFLVRYTHSGMHMLSSWTIPSGSIGHIAIRAPSSTICKRREIVSNASVCLLKNVSYFQYPNSCDTCGNQYLALLLEYYCSIQNTMTKVIIK